MFLIFHLSEYRLSRLTRKVSISTACIFDPFQHDLSDRFIGERLEDCNVAWLGGEVDEVFEDGDVACGSYELDRFAAVITNEVAFAESVADQTFDGSFDDDRLGHAGSRVFEFDDRPRIGDETALFSVFPFERV